MIARAFKETGIIERYGSGIARIKNECREDGVIEPIFEEFVHGFRVILFKEKVNEGIKRLFNYIKKNPNRRISQISKDLEIPSKTLERWVKQLREENRIEYKGSKRTGGYWEVIDE